MIRPEVPRIFVIITVLFVFTVSVNAEVPSVINYQGRLTNPDGTPVEDNDYQMKFIIYGSDDGNDSLWSSGFHDVPVVNGLFTYMLGSNAPLPDNIFDSPDRYLGITVGLDPEIIGRTLFTTSAYTFKALKSDTTDYAKSIADLSVTQNKIANNAINTFHIQDGSIDLVDLGSGGAADGETIIWNNSVMEWETGAAGSGDITAVYPGSGLTGGGSSGDVTLSIGAGAINASHMATNSVQSDAIAPNAVGTSEIDNNAVGASEIADGVIYSNHLADHAVTLSKIAQNAVTDYEIATGAVGASEIATDAVNYLEIAANAVRSDEIADDAVGSSEIADDAVGASEIATGAVTSDEIEDETITNDDISPSANIQNNKILGTAATWYNNNYYYAPNFSNDLFQFNDSVKFTRNYGGFGKTIFYDSTMVIDENGISIGRLETPSNTTLMRINRYYNSAAGRYGIYTKLENSGDGTLIGNYTHVEHTSPTLIPGIYTYGVRSWVWSNAERRFGVFGIAYAATDSLNEGYSYGVNGSAYGGAYNYGVYGSAVQLLTARYGVYGTAGGSNYNYGVYCYGNLHSTGTNTKAGGGYRIDHPDDPGHMYLQHSDVSSPDMMNIYNGNVTTDLNGEATVKLPDYFESLNSDFRYQLTAIGTFANAIISEEIKGNVFSIKTDKPYVKVSWQVTGIRQDAFAKAQSMDVEVVKDATKQGRYQNPELFGFGIEQSVDYENHLNNPDKEESE